jgi:putative nucleotidyltransferase with HDIG domain
VLKAMKDLRATGRREIQLDAISALLVVAMLLVVGLLLYYMSFSGVRLPEWVPLASYIPQVLLSGFVLLVVLYLWDERRKLSREVVEAWATAEEATEELSETVSWLEFSHESASRLGTQGVKGGLKQVLAEAAALFDAGAAAVLGEDDEYTFVAPGEPAREAERALTHVALVAAGHATPLHIQSLGTEEGQALAVPLRVQDDLRYVLCMWRRNDDFTPEQLHALGLMGRMIELALEREESLAEAQQQLEGTLRVLQHLVADKRPDYSRHAVGVAELAAAIGQKMGMRPQARRDLRLAGLIHDVGMMSLPEQIGDSDAPLTPAERRIVNRHSAIGAEIAKAANFDVVVQEAIAGHHERMDGSGYPNGASGARIPLEARIIAVCEVFDSMTHRTYHGAGKTTDQAIAEIRRGAGTLYDSQVSAALLGVIADSAEQLEAATFEEVTAEEAVSLAASLVH